MKHPRRCSTPATSDRSTMMREFLARAYLHPFALGEASSLEAAEMVATELDNPALHRKLARLVG